MRGFKKGVVKEFNTFSSQFRECSPVAAQDLLNQGMVCPENSMWVVQKCTLYVNYLNFYHREQNQEPSAPSSTSHTLKAYSRADISLRAGHQKFPTIPIVGLQVVNWLTMV